MTPSYTLALMLTALLGTSSASAQTAAEREAELVAAVAKRPSALEPYRELAQLYSLTGRREEGERLLRQALAVHSNSGAVFDAMASLYKNPRDPDKILAIAQEWTKADPADSKPLILAAQVHISRAGERRDTPVEAAMHLDRALQVLDEAIQMSPSDHAPRAMRVGAARQRVSITEDPEERARLLREIDAATWESDKTPQPPPPSAEQSAAFPKAIRVGGNVAPPVKTRDLRPKYPEAAREARVQGVVILEIVIAESGSVADARVLRSIPALDAAAVEAVRQWQFAPTLLNGEAIPVIMTVTVQFTLAEGR
jgi:TonB family protein